MEREGVIEDHVGPAPWISNLVLAPKEDGGIRVTVDMREPNKAILDTGLLIPKPEDIRKELAAIGSPNSFSKQHSTNWSWMRSPDTSQSFRTMEN